MKILLTITLKFITLNFWLFFLFFFFNLHLSVSEHYSVISVCFSEATWEEAGDIQASREVCAWIQREGEWRDTYGSASKDTWKLLCSTCAQTRIHHEDSRVHLAPFSLVLCRDVRGELVNFSDSSQQSHDYSSVTGHRDWPAVLITWQLPFVGVVSSRTLYGSGSQRLGRRRGVRRTRHCHSFADDPLMLCMF